MIITILSWILVVIMIKILITTQSGKKRRYRRLYPKNIIYVVMAMANRTVILERKRRSSYRRKYIRRLLMISILIVCRIILIRVRRRFRMIISMCRDERKEVRMLGIEFGIEFA